MTNIIFYRKSYKIDPDKLAFANDNVSNHIASFSSDNGTPIYFNGADHNLNKSRLTDAKARLNNRLNTLPSGSIKVALDNNKRVISGLDDATENIVTHLTERAGKEGVNITAVLGEAVLGTMLLGVGNRPAATAAILGKAPLGAIILGYR